MIKELFHSLFLILYTAIVFDGYNANELKYLRRALKTNLCKFTMDYCMFGRTFPRWRCTILALFIMGPIRSH